MRGLLSYGSIVLLVAGGSIAREEPSSQAWLGPADLAKASKEAPPLVAKLLQQLSRPADEVVLADGTPLMVSPVPRFLGKKAAFSGELDLVILEKKEPRKVKGSEVLSFTPYEERALAQIGAWQTEVTKNLDAEVTFKALEESLRAVLRFHLETRARPIIGDNPWQDVNSRIERELRQVQRGHLKHRIDNAADKAGWISAERLAHRLLELYPEDTGIADEARRLWTRAADKALKAGQVTEARVALRRLDERFVFSPEADGLREALRARAESLLQESETLPDQAAAAKLKEALGLWPRLPGLRDALIKREKAYRILYVGVRELPENLSPATACSEAETQAVELLFESLVQPGGDATRGQAFVPRLALRLPAPASASGEGWQQQFALRRDAYWSDGERVTSADVRHTILLLGSPKLAGRQPAWSSLVDVPRVEQAGFDVKLHLRQHVLEPLSFLGFKVLPQRYRGKPLERADNPDFARAPVGSGPYVYRGRRTEGGREYAVFAANPHFDRGSLQAIREIRMFAWKTPGDLRTVPHPIHLILGIRTEELAGLRALGFAEVRSQPARRLAVLAVNHRVPALANHSLRRFLAHAIDREELLAEHFRGGSAVLRRLGPLGSGVALVVEKTVSPHPEFHLPLNGPYPAKSWALCPPPRVAGVLYDTERAKSLARQAHKDLGPVRLVLKVPAEDPRVLQACTHLAEDVSRLAAEAGADIQLRIEALPSRKLKQAIETRDYQVAYWELDYADATCWLWPLFDPSADAVAPGGSNLLGYDNDAKLQSLFRVALGQRDFAVLRDLTHNIHAHLVERMPLIPLWQLHHHVAIHPRLRAGDLDPQRVFTHAARWTLDAE